MNLREKFEYNNGDLIWKRKNETSRFDVSWNARHSGNVAGTPSTNGYVKINVSGKILYAHRLVWEYHYGEIPKGMFIDHINRNKSDNRIENLRLVTPQDNSRNMGKNKRNSSGFNGVCFDSKLCKYRAYIGVDDKMVSIGNYDTIEEAVLARIEKNKELGFFNDHGVGISK